jgi:CheY-like chemotaxis protein
VVVDDEPELLELVCTVLGEEGYAVTCLGHPREVEALDDEGREPGLFVLDIMLPEISGIELARRLREHGHRHTPMIAMSASPEMVRAARESNLFQEALPKPFELDAFLDAIARQMVRCA